jgi:hypothetical protein
VDHVSEVGRVSLPVGDLCVLVFDHFRPDDCFRESRLADTGDSGSSRAEQAARANDHIRHVLCSEQHKPRRLRSWLILSVRRMYSKIQGSPGAASATRKVGSVHR